MAKYHDDTFRFCLDTLIAGKPFSLSQLKKNIINKGFFPKVNFGFGIKGWVDEIEEDKTITYDPSLKKYRVNNTDYVLMLRKSYYESVSFNPDLLKYEQSKRAEQSVKSYFIDKN